MEEKQVYVALRYAHSTNDRIVLADDEHIETVNALVAIDYCKILFSCSVANEEEAEVRLDAFHKKEEAERQARAKAERQARIAARTKNGKICKRVSIYFHEQQYGGSEEGGWYYHTSKLVKTVQVPLSRVKFWKNRFQMEADTKTEQCKSGGFWGRQDYYSAVVENDYAENQNLSRQRYE